MPHTIIETCIGCTACARRCPTNAISGVRDRVHVVDPMLCIDCGACGVVCPPQAILDETGGRCRWRPRWPKAIVIGDNCIGSGCELCIQICPANALSLGQMDRIVGDFFGVAVLNERKCTGCGLCEQICGWGAIYVDPPREMLTERAWPEAASARPEEAVIPA